MKNIMLDLETMGNGSNAAIISIGAVFFEPLTGETSGEFYQVVDLNDSARFGELDAGTVKWWMGRSDEARAMFKDESKVYLIEALGEFSQWIEDNCDRDEKDRTNAVVWGNGASFDNVILRNAYKAVCLKAPWFFANDRDVRTVVDLGRYLRNIDPKKELPIEGVAHNALDDAYFQVSYVSTIIMALA